MNKSEPDNNEFLDFMEDEIEIISTDRQQLALNQIESYYSQSMKLAKQAEIIVVEDVPSSSLALDIVATARSLASQIESDRKRFIAPMRREIQSINDCAKGLQETLMTLSSTILVKIAAWQRAQELKALEAKEKVHELSESLGLDIAILAPDAPKNISSEKATTVHRKKLSFQIEDANLIPDEYWIIDEKMIQKHIDLGKRDIPGIKVVVESSLIIRRK